MRRDIEIHINTGDVALSSIQSHNLMEIEWSDSGVSQQYLYGEVEVPIHIPIKSIFENGIKIAVGYTPIFLPIQLRIKRVADDGSFEYLVNPSDNTDWFKVVVSLYGVKVRREIKASELTLIDDSSLLLKFEDERLVNGNTRYTGVLQVFSAHSIDFNIKNANHQNSNLLLKCLPTNSYRYPLSGVGLIRWTNGEISQSKLAETIKNEFAEDGVVIRTAKYNDDTEKLSIDANFDDLD